MSAGSAGASPQTLLGAYSAPPDNIAGFKGAASRQKGHGGERSEGLGDVARGEGREMGKGVEKGDVGENSALAVGG